MQARLRDALHTSWRDTVLKVICDLLFTTLFCDFERSFDGFRLPIGIENHPSVLVASRSSGGLYQTRFAAKKALFVGIENRHQSHFRQIETIAQKIESLQKIEIPQAQISKDFHAVERIDIRVQVFDAYLCFAEE